MSSVRQPNATRQHAHSVPGRKPIRALCARCVPGVLALVPFSSVAALIARYKVDIPYWDEWNFVPVLQRSYEGNLSLTDLWAQHNEHRILFPRLIMLLLARATGWNISYELAANVLLAAGILAALVWQINSSRKLTGDRGPNWLVLAVSLMVFSLSQWENWLWGWQICVFLNVLAVAAGIAVLASAGLRWWRFPAAIFLGVVASYSFASGLAYWLAALPVLLARPSGSRQAKCREVAIWLLSAAATLVLYLYHYHAPAAHPRSGLALAQPIELAKYILIYLGRPVSANHALRAGTLGLVALLAMAFLSRRSLGRNRAHMPLPYLSLSLYAVLSAAMAGVGRVGFGFTQALSPRYVTMSNLLWVSNIVLLYLLVKGEASHPRGPHPLRGLRRFSLAAGLVALVLMISLAFWTSIQAAPGFAMEHERRAAALAELRSAHDGRVPRAIYPSQRQRGTELEVLRRYHLSLFREIAD